MSIVRWSWANDDGSFVPYDAEVSARLEAGFQARTKSAKKVPTDAHRHVDVVDMMQYRNDDPDKQVVARRSRRADD